MHIPLAFAAVAAVIIHVIAVFCTGRLMKIVIQHVSDRNIDDRIMEFEGEVLRLGRASDQDIRIDQPELR